MIYFHHLKIRVCRKGAHVSMIWASSRENLSSGFPKKRVTNKIPQLHRLARKLKFTCSKFTYDTFHKANNKGADQTARMRRLVCACVVRKPPMTVFLATRPISKDITMIHFMYSCCLRANIMYGVHSQKHHTSKTCIRYLAWRICWVI